MFLRVGSCHATLVVTYVTCPMHEHEVGRFVIDLVLIDVVDDTFTTPPEHVDGDTALDTR